MYDTDWLSATPPGLGSDIRARGQDVAYLLEAMNHCMPPLQLAAGDVLSTFAGLRPLLATGADPPSQTSREHDIALQPDGLMNRSSTARWKRCAQPASSVRSTAA